MNTIKQPLNQCIKKNEKGLSLGIILLALYIILKPFYFFPSGGFQLADIFLIILFFSILFGMPGLIINNYDIMSYMLALAIVITFVSGVWALILSDTKLLMPILFFVFNLFLFLSVSHILTTNKNSAKYILYAVIAAVFLQLLLLPISMTGFSRQILFFNNPNQLGYWSILSASLFLYLVQKVEISKTLYILFTGGVLILAGLSLSKAAIVSLFLLYFLYYGNRPIVGIMFAAAIVLVFIFASELELVSNVIDRLNAIGTGNDDNAEARGYDRIWNFPEYLWFGNGEGAIKRFGAIHELHSTLGMLFFSYGPFGIFVFIAIFIRLLFTRGIEAVLPFIPLFAYSLTHQGFRFSLFWLVLAVVSTKYLGNNIINNNTINNEMKNKTI